MLHEQEQGVVGGAVYPVYVWRYAISPMQLCTARSGLVGGGRPLYLGRDMWWWGAGAAHWLTVDIMQCTVHCVLCRYCVLYTALVPTTATIIYV